jgi:vacuolar protein-sorting-associated protein 4
MEGGASIREKAIAFVNDAVREDKDGNYEAAFKLYMKALDHFTCYLKYEKNPRLAEMVNKKFKEYLERAEELHAIVQGKKNAKEVSGTGASGAQRAKPQDGGEDAELAKMKGQLGSAIVTEKPNVKWDDVAGLQAAKEALKEAVVLPVKFPQFFTGKRKAWSGFLLYGPPGTGKSYLAKAVATEADSTFFSISSSDLVSKWMGESEKLVSQLFNMAREQAPSIIFIDEIDALCGARGENGESEASRRIKTEILVQMQGVGNSSGKVLVLAATNTPYALDQAVRRRFDKRIYIPLPDAAARAHIFRVHVGETPNDLTDEDYQSLGAVTEGFSGSDIDHVVKDVLYEPVRKVQEATHFVTIKNPANVSADTPVEDEYYVPCSPGDSRAWPSTLDELARLGYAARVLPPPITANDFRKVLLRARPTVAAADLELHERFTREFGEEG